MWMAKGASARSPVFCMIGFILQWGFRESVLKKRKKGKLRPGQCFAVMRFDSHARHIRPLEKRSLSDFRLKSNAGA